MTMSDNAAGGPTNPAATTADKAAGAALAAFFVTLLIGSECMSVSGAATWALGSAFGLGGSFLTGLEGLALAGSLIVTALFAKTAYRAERRYRSSPSA